MAHRSAPILLVVAALLLGGLPSGAARDNGFAPECADAATLSAPTVGAVDCVRLPSEMLGATTAFSYYVPPGCDPALGRDCPVLYYLHGTGGSYREGLGAKGSAGSAWVRALTSGPPVDVRAEAEPWRWANPATWVAKPALDLILVAPHGLTLPGGHGPGPNQNPFWMDWNPRYAQGGDTPRYDTPPPRFESHVIGELIPFVDAWLPTSGDREQRAIVGYSMGGNGAFHIGLKHPDRFASMGMRSGPTLPS
ncbi:MAG TPA: alpha/beta hydrolase-fold protein, partial [Egibacteraceae bacterium]|nr:alpha/beta hydrolase-fold protein [Egibacteraceae bacterium]